jgi:transcriptional regulator with XRE-family HTH domain
MQITCLHSASKNGIPVILDNDGEVMPYGEGLTLALKYLQLTRAQLAKVMGYKSVRSIEKFWQGTTPPAHLLNMLAKNIHMAEAYDKLTGFEQLLEMHPDLLTPEYEEQMTNLRDITLWGKASQ